MSRRIGLFGGTFDPIHNAHLRMALAAAEQCDLALVLLVPAACPPHRLSGTHAPFSDRLRMVEIAAAGQPLLQPSLLDDVPGKSYSVSTAERLLSTLPPGDEIYFLIGADAFAELRSWFRWQDLARLVTFAVVGRPGAAFEIPDAVRVARVTGLNLPISSSEIRSRLAAGDTGVDLPPGVLSYIRNRHLYGVRPDPGHNSSENP